MTADIVNREEFIELIKNKFEFCLRKSAIVTVDMHRGHLDPKIATMPANPEDGRRIVENTQKLLNLSRSHGIPVIHTVLVFREIPGLGTEGAPVKFWRAVEDSRQSLNPTIQSNIKAHNLLGSVQTEVMPQLLTKGDYLIDTKKRMSCFYGTDLEILLRILKVETIILTGINTNTCVLSTAFEAFSRDLVPVVISDCVASMYGEDLHQFGLQNISRCMGWVFSFREFENKLREHTELCSICKPT